LKRQGGEVLPPSPKKGVGAHKKTLWGHMQKKRRLWGKTKDTADINIAMKCPLIAEWVAAFFSQPNRTQGGKS